MAGQRRWIFPSFYKDKKEKEMAGQRRWIFHHFIRMRKIKKWQSRVGVCCPGVWAWCWEWNWWWTSRVASLQRKLPKFSATGQYALSTCSKSRGAWCPGNSENSRKFVVIWNQANWYLSKNKNPDPPTHLYLIVFVRKSASSMDVCAYLSKYRQLVSRKYESQEVNERELVASEVDLWVLLELRFVDSSIFKAISGPEVYGQSWMFKEVLFKPMNTDFAFKALQKLAIFRYMAGLNSKLLVASDFTKPKRRKNARNQGNKLWPDNNRSRKDVLASAEAAHMVHCFWRKCSAVFNPERI